MRTRYEVALAFTVPALSIGAFTLMGAAGGQGPDLGGITLQDVITYGGQVTGNIAMFMFIVAIFRGWVYPRNVVNDLKETIKEVKAERDEALKLAQSANAIARSGTQTNDRLAVSTKETATLAQQLAAVLQSHQNGA